MNDQLAERLVEALERMAVSAEHANFVNNRILEFWQRREDNEALERHVRDAADMVKVEALRASIAEWDRQHPGG